MTVNPFVPSAVGTTLRHRRRAAANDSWRSAMGLHVSKSQPGFTIPNTGAV
jgi:hypothetical protein